GVWRNAPWLPSSSKVRSLGEGQTTRLRVPRSTPTQKDALLLGLALRRRLFLFGEVIVRRKRIRREHEALGRYHLRGVFALRLVDLLEKRVLRRLLRGDDVPGLQEVDQDLRRRAQDLRAVLGAHLLDRVGVLLL